MKIKQKFQLIINTRDNPSQGDALFVNGTKHAHVVHTRYQVHPKVALNENPTWFAMLWMFYNFTTGSTCFRLTG